MHIYIYMYIYIERERERISSKKASAPLGLLAQPLVPRLARGVNISYNVFYITYYNILCYRL